MLDMMNATHTGAEKMTGTLTGLTMSKTPGPVRLHGVQIGRTVNFHARLGWLVFNGSDKIGRNWGTAGSPEYDMLAALDREAHARAGKLND